MIDIGSFRFRREERLKGRKEIRDVFSRGKRYGCFGAKLFVLKNDLTYNRICFTFPKASKKSVFGKAVARNRVKRLNREVFRLMKSSLLGGHDLVLLIYPDEGTPGSFSNNSRLQSRRRQLESLFLKAGLLK